MSAFLLARKVFLSRKEILNDGTKAPATSPFRLLGTFSVAMATTGGHKGTKIIFSVSLLFEGKGCMGPVWDQGYNKAGFKKRRSNSSR